jgi:AmmeMemoRadiSam system protein A
VRNSGDTQGGRARVVGYGAFAFEYAHAASIDAGARRLLLDVAREAIARGIANSDAPPEIAPAQIPAPLRAQRATFVTLSIAGRLRGCRGSILPHRPLLLDVAENARQSAFDDPRFPPLTQEELRQIALHVSILSTPRRVRAGSEAELARMLRPDIDGLIVRDFGRQAIFLPSVWSGIPEPLTFIRHLKHKAGLAPDHWSESFEAYRFVSESFGEESHARA